MSAGRKPVIVRKLTRDWCAGYAAANPAGEADELELLDTQGKLVRMAWSQVKWVCYVRELAAGEGSGPETVHPERLMRRRFANRPRMTGVWLRLTLGDGDELEGVAANDRSLVDGAGLLLTPPDTRSNTQRVFVPRGAIRELSVLGVVMPKPRTAHEDDAQPELFERDSGEL